MTALPLIADPAAPPTLRIGDRAPSFEELLGVDGRRYSLGSFADAPILALIFASNRCPTVKAYEGRLAALNDAYGSRGVQIVAINSNDPHLYPDESYSSMVEFTRTSGWRFPYLFDDGQRVARMYGPQRTFHAFVLDPARILRYEGRFDDSRIPERVTRSDLSEAVDDLLVGREVRVASTRPFGCSLDYL